MITHNVKLDVMEEGRPVSVSGTLTRCEDLGTNEEDASLVSGKFELALDDGQGKVLIRGSRTEFTRILKFMDE